MNHSRLTLGKASLLILGLGTGALMGVPGFGIEGAPLGPIEGLVRSDAGENLEGVEVVLFDDANLSLLEITRTDAQGRFAFGQEPDRYHVFASLPEHNPMNLVGGWAYDQVRSHHGGIEIQLFEGQWLAVEALDPTGQPLEEAEVRILDASYETPCVVQRVLTDAEGQARILVPVQSHLGLFAGSEWPVQWLTGLELSPGQEQLSIAIPRGRRLNGVLLGPDGTSLQGAIVSAWDTEASSWYGWTKTNAEGEYALVASEDATLLRVVDPSGTHLPEQRELPSEQRVVPDWNLVQGQSKSIQTDSLESGLAARVWVWSEETQAWGWGLLTDSEGALETKVAPHHSVVAVPLDSEGQKQEAWDLKMAPGELQLNSAEAEGN